MTGPRRLAMPVLIVTALLFGGVLHAQFVDWPPTPQQFGIFRFDSTFMLGAHTLLYPDIAKNTFHMSFSQEYAKSVEGVRNPVEHPDNPEALKAGQRYLRSDTIGFKYIWLVNNLPYYVYESKSKQNWYDTPPGSGVLNADFKTPFWETWYPTAIWKLDTFKKGDDYDNQKFFTFLTITARNPSNPSDTTGTVMMGGDARYMTELLTRSDTTLYDRLFHIWHDAAGNVRPQQVADSLAAIYDKSRVFDVSVGIRADSAALVDGDLNIPDSAALGYLDVFIRDTMMQARPKTARFLDSMWVHTGFDTVWINPLKHEYRLRQLGEWRDTAVTAVSVDTCRCAIYRRIKRDTITKIEYLNVANQEHADYAPVGDGFYEVSTEVDPSPWYPIRFDDFSNLDDQPLQFGGQHGEPGPLSYCEWMFNYRRSLSPSDPLHLPDGSILRFRRDYFWQNEFWTSTVEGAEMLYRFFTTRRVDLSFLRGRVSQRMMGLMEDGVLDSAIRAEVLDVYNYPLYNRLLMRLGIADEVFQVRYRAQNYINGLVQSVMTDSNDARGLWLNPPENPDGIRVGMGDFDSLRLAPNGPLNKKMIHMAARQAYKLGLSAPIPLTYLNPDTLSSYARDTVYKLAEKEIIRGGDTILQRAIARNSLWDHRYYNRIMQDQIFGSFYDRTTDHAALHEAGIIPSLARTIDVYRFKYRDLSEYSNPVLNVVQTHGFYRFQDNGHKFYRRGGFGTRIPTPEEIIGQSWASIACNVNGLIFGDFQDDGHTMGIIQVRTDNYSDEYGTLFSPPPTSILDSIPGTWLGRKSRFEAVREVTTAIHHIDSIVGWRKLLYEQDQMSLHDSRADFSTMPMLSSVRAERPHRYGYTSDTTAQGFKTYGFSPSDTFDTPEETFMEVTQFYPSTADLPGSASNSRYLLFFNRRLWPVDDHVYNSDSVAILDAAALYTGSSSDTGLGAIDVRRPVVTLKNSTSTMADSFIVEKISPLGTWRDTLACGVETPLDWITPGRADFYKITPIPRGVSAYGTAFNNSTHAENLSTDAAENMRVVVVERDSAIYLRRFHSTTGWEPDVLISPSVDSTRMPNGSLRIAHCTYPAIATVRDDSATLVVWQRVESGGQKLGAIDALYIPGPPTNANIAAGRRLRLSTPRPIDQTWKKMVPAVTGVDGGWVVAWGSPASGIELVGVRNTVNPNPVSDISLVGRVKAVAVAYGTRSVYIDSICSFPSLAYVSNASVPGTDTTAAKTLHWAHLAWQQGNDSSAGGTLGAGPYIMYKIVGVNIPDSGRPTLNLTTLEEHVSQGLPGCRFLHPSIAVDSARVGVAFESHLLIAPTGLPNPTPVGPIQVVTLRFRDSLVTGGLAGAAGGWRTPVYQWGDSINRYEYPSFTQFPKRSRNASLFTPAGALAWHGLPRFGSTRSRQYFYRTGDRMSVELPFGLYPTLMNSPYVTANPLSHTGVVYRGDGTTGVAQSRGWGETATYYPGYTLMEPTGSAFTGLFAAAPKAHGIYGSFTLGNWSAVDSGAACDFKVISGGLRIRWPGLDHWPPHHENQNPGLPEIFGGIALEPGETWVTSIEEAGEVSRTSVFTAGTDPVLIDRYVSVSANIDEWLNEYPYDTVMGSLSDVKVLLELVRASGNVVLWRDDTISARLMVPLVLNEEVEVPVDLYTTPGEVVYIRLRAVATAGLEYDVSGGFHFYEDLPGIQLTKRGMGRGVEGGRSVQGSQAGLSAQVFPNPTTGRVRIVWVVEKGSEGQGEIAIYDVSGTTLYRTTLSGSQHDFLWNTEDLPSGVYYVTLRIGVEQVTQQFSVVK